MTRVMAAYMRTRRAERRQRLLTMAGGQCSRCGSGDSLEFDHRDRATCDFRLSGKGLDNPWSTILLELAKCDLLCHDCHRAKTKIRGEVGGGQNRIERVHGTAHCYEAGCRRPECRKAKSLYRRKLIGFSERLAA